jgi:hypothetical protein
MKLERLTHLCLIVVSVAALAILIEKRFAPPPEPLGSAKALVGKRIDIPGLRWASSRLNAVFYISASCHFCQASMPFYREVSEARSGTNKRVALSILTVGSESELRKLLSAESILVDGFYSVPGNIRLRGTPTLLIVDDHGRVLEVFEGMLDAPRQRAVLELVRAGSLGG